MEKKKTTYVPTKADKDNRSDQMNKNNKKYYLARGVSNTKK